MAAGEDHLHAGADLLDLEDHRADAVADVVDLTAHLLGAGEDPLHVVSEVDDDGVAFEPLHGPVDDLTDLHLELFVEASPAPLRGP